MMGNRCGVSVRRLAGPDALQRLSAFVATPDIAEQLRGLATLNSRSIQAWGSMFQPTGETNCLPFGLWGCFLQDEQLVSLATLGRSPVCPHSACLGYATLPTWRNRGLAAYTATKALQQAAEGYCFNVHCVIKAQNTASLAIVGRLGFSMIGHTCIDDRTTPLLCFERTVSPDMPAFGRDEPPPGFVADVEAWQDYATVARKL